MSKFNENVFNATNLTVAKRDRLFKAEKLDGLRDAAVAKRKRSLERLEDLWTLTADRFRQLGVDVVFADTGDEANAIIADRLAGCSKVVKGKSLTTEETGLRQVLESSGMAVTETDLGEWIIQQRDELPSHVTAPAIHLSAGEVADMIHRKLGVKLEADPAALTRFVRGHLRDAFLQADAGIIGANMIIADPATVMCISNEGNVSLSARLPGKLVVMVGVDRIYDNPEGIQDVQRLLSASATGQHYPSYVDFIRKPLPHQDVLIVVLDNGRRQLLAGEFAEAGRCIRCGACLNICPVYQEVGGHTFGKVYHGGIGALLTAFTGDGADAAFIADYCTRCGSCEPACPMDVPISGLVARLAADHDLPFYLKLPLDKLMKPVGAHGEDAVRSDATGEATGIFMGCTFRTPLLGKERKAILKAATQLAGEPVFFDEGCCGMPHFYKGMVEEADVREQSLQKLMADMDRVLVPCSSGYDFLRKRWGERVELMSIALAKNMGQVTTDRRVFYHLPCHLKNEAGEREFNALARIIPLEEWETGERCCGSAGTYFIQHPAISKRILKRKSIPGKAPFVIITSCPSCLLQLRRTFGRKNVSHVVDFLLSMGTVLHSG